MRFHILASLMVLAAVLGCGQEEPIKSYTIDAPTMDAQTVDAQTADAQTADAQSADAQSADAQTVDRSSVQTQDRMLGAIIPRGAQAWFFKMAGPADTVKLHEADFRDFIASIEFPDTAGDRPQWRLPEGWREEAGTGMRLATLRMGQAGQELELTVIPLPHSGENDQQYILSNVNRWRGQLGLGPIDQGKLADVTSSLGEGPAAVTIVELTGKLVPGGMR